MTRHGGPVTFTFDLEERQMLWLAMKALRAIMSAQDQGSAAADLKALMADIECFRQVMYSGSNGEYERRIACHETLVERLELTIPEESVL